MNESGIPEQSTWPPPKPPVSPAGQIMLLIGLYGLGFLVAQFVAAIALVPFVDISTLNLEDLESLDSPGIVSGLKLGQFLAAIVSFILPALLFSRIVKEPFLPMLKLNRSASPVFWLITPVILLTSMPLIAWLATLNKELPLPDFLVKLENEAERLTKIFLSSEGPTDLVINLIIIAVTAAFAEEIFFRGCLQRAFIKAVKGPHLAIWVTAILFSALHFQFLGFFPRMLLGAVMGYLFYWSGSLWIPIFAHFINNAIGVILNYLSQKGTITETTENYGSESSDISGVIIGAVLMFTFMVLAYRARVMRDEEVSV